jgi:hypothetical protein
VLSETLDTDPFSLRPSRRTVPGFRRDDDNVRRYSHLNARFSDHSSRRNQTVLASLAILEEEDVMERRDFLKVSLGFVAGAVALAASAHAAPLPPIAGGQALVLPRGEGAEPAVVSQEDVDRLKPEQVRWGHHHGHWHGHWHRRHWGWHRRHWGWRHHWHRRHWGWHHRHWRHW